MSAGLARQLTGYGDVFAAEVDALSRETIMTTDEAIIAIDRNEHDKKRSPWLRVSALVGAAAVVIAATVGLTVLRTGNDVVAAPPYATVEDAARARGSASPTSLLWGTRSESNRAPSLEICWRRAHS